MKPINEHLETIMKFRNEPTCTNADFKLFLEGFRDICITYGGVKALEGKAPLEVFDNMDKLKDDMFESMNSIFKPDNQN